MGKVNCESRNFHSSCLMVLWLSTVMAGLFSYFHDWKRVMRFLTFVMFLKYCSSASQKPKCLRTLAFHAASAGWVSRSTTVHAIDCLSASLPLTRFTLCFRLTLLSQLTFMKIYFSQMWTSSESFPSRQDVSVLDFMSYKYYLLEWVNFIQCHQFINIVVGL